MESNTTTNQNKQQQLNQQNIPPPSSAAFITPQITKRVLHRDDDLLPFTSQQNLTADIYKLKSSTSSKQNITKRHLASNTGPSSNANNYEEIVNMYASASLNKIKSDGSAGSKPSTATDSGGDKPTRKIAVLTNSSLLAGHKYKGGQMPGSEYEEVQTFGVQSTASFSKADKETIDRMAKKLKKIESESLGNFETVGYGQIRGSAGLITPGSWRIGEALVQKQLKQHLRQQQQAKQQMKMNEAEEMQQKKAGGKKLLGDDERRSASGR